jgi:hypothetical protein
MDKPCRNPASRPARKTAPDPAAVYAENAAAEVEGTPRPSALRALGLTVVQLTRYHDHDDDALGRAVRRAVVEHGDGDLPAPIP